VPLSRPPPAGQGSYPSGLTRRGRQGWPIGTSDSETVRPSGRRYEPGVGSAKRAGLLPGARRSRRRRARAAPTPLARPFPAQHLRRILQRGGESEADPAPQQARPAARGTAIRASGARERGRFRPARGSARRAARRDQSPKGPAARPDRRALRRDLQRRRLPAGQPQAHRKRAGSAARARPREARAISRGWPGRVAKRDGGRRMRARAVQRQGYRPPLVGRASGLVNRGGRTDVGEQAPPPRRGTPPPGGELHSLGRGRSRARADPSPLDEGEGGSSHPLGRLRFRVQGGEAGPGIAIGERATASGRRIKAEEKARRPGLTLCPR